MPDVVVSVRDLQTTFHTKLGPVRAVDGISYEIGKGRTLGIVGESGCGKSVASYSLMRLIEPPGEITGGEVRLHGEDLLALPEERMADYRGSRMAMIFQEPMTALNPVLTIGYQMDEQIMRHKGLARKASRDRALEMLDRVGIPSPRERYDSYPHQLSGGMRQRAMIAMALSCDPEFLIADEPTTALDVTIQAQILDLLNDLRRETGTSVIIITHDLGVVAETADKVAVMYLGHIVEFGPAECIYGPPYHPYTEALLSAVPIPDPTAVQKHIRLSGTVPSALHPPSGCVFHTRCPRRSLLPDGGSICERETPPQRDNTPAHRIYCHVPLEELRKMEPIITTD